MFVLLFVLDARTFIIILVSKTSETENHEMFILNENRRSALSWFVEGFVGLGT